MTRAPLSCEVIIVGAGPVGLTLALLLARAGIDTQVFEREAALARDLRASTFHPPTLDMLARIGFGEDMHARGLVCPHWQIRLHPSGERAVFDLSVLKAHTRHPWRLQLEQWKLSEMLLAALAQEARARVHFGADVESAVASDEDAAITLATGARYTARCVIGADGARSVVRHAMGLPFEGATYPETTLLATTTFPFEDHLEGLSNVSYCWKPDGNFSLLKVPGRWRVSLYPREDVSIEEQMAPDAIAASLNEIVPRAGASDVMELRPYRVHQRIVPHYRKGRLALAGDAAHLNSPAGGMGLNGGIHDAFELADALADILRRNAPLERLDLYDRRRRPVARDQIIAQAHRNRARMREKDPARRRDLLAQMQAITQDRARLEDHLLQSSMIAGLRTAAAIT